jgi:hypothetical protein
MMTGDLTFTHVSPLEPLRVNESSIDSTAHSTHPFATVIWPFLQRALAQNDFLVQRDGKDKEAFDALLPFPTGWRQLFTEDENVSGAAAMALGSHCTHSAIVWLMYEN